LTRINKECYERGCACHDDRVDEEAVEVVRRTWVGLTPDELNAIFDSMKTWSSFQITDVYFAIEAKLKEKNS
jgi:hypothetical protein